MDSGNQPSQKRQPPVSLWTSIGLLILLSFLLVGLFAGFIYIFTSGAEQRGLPVAGQVVIFVVISGIFAWLLKRVTDIVSGLSHWWFPEETDGSD
jgi:formate hydrogenlyase subunit 3/multisubunit Na+/H+ antiporter MnhD subunit